MQITLLFQLFLCEHIRDVTRYDCNAALEKLSHLRLREPDRFLPHIDGKFNLPVRRFEQHDALLVRVPIHMIEMSQEFMRHSEPSVP